MKTILIMEHLNKIYFMEKGNLEAKLIIINSLESFKMGKKNKANYIGHLISLFTHIMEVLIKTNNFKDKVISIANLG